MAALAADGRSTRNPIVADAIKDFARCVSWESSARTLALEDYKFAEADSDNGFAWPDDISGIRKDDERPCLTVNRVRQHNLQIINDSKQNKPSIVIRATGNGATYESAKTCEAIIRHIEYASNAQTAYSTAVEHQVKSGIGWLRVVREYENDDDFDQVLSIKRVVDPNSIYMDPDAKEADKSDAKFAFVYDDVLKTDFDEAYPEFKGFADQTAMATGYSTFVQKDHIRVCEYWRREFVKDQILALPGPDGKPRTIRKSQLPKAIWNDVLQDASIQKRDVVTIVVSKHIIVGHELVETTKEPGKYIPLVPVIGEETIIDGKLDRKGHTRAMKDPQRIYNFWTSSAVENVALQTKTPWIAPAAAIESYEMYWNTANRVNHSVLPYNAWDDAGNQLPSPSRPEPPAMAPAYITGMQIATNELMMVSGQHEPMMGEPSNERSGKALMERQRKGDNATYHYIDNLAVAIRHLGKIILDLIPKVYDTKRVLRILAIDGTDYEIDIDPQAKQSYIEHLNHDQEVVQRIFNPNVGKYDVQADVGPAYGTQREQMFEALTTLIAQAPNMANLVGDIWMRAADFPGADEAAERFKRMLPPQALGKGPSQAEQQLQQQVQNLTKMLTQALDQNTMDKIKLKGKEEMRQIDAFEADTHRLKILADHGIDTGTLAVLRAQLMHDMQQNQMDLVHNDAHKNADRVVAGMGTNEDGSSAEVPQVGKEGEEAAEQTEQGEAPGGPPVPGARQARDGKWYVQDPSRPGKFARVGA